jgi:hypothetical protein
MRNFFKRIGGFSHRGYHYEELLITELMENGNQGADSFSGTDTCSPEFEYLHENWKFCQR